jgi:hypothetical protein
VPKKKEHKALCSFQALIDSYDSIFLAEEYILSVKTQALVEQTVVMLAWLEENEQLLQAFWQHHLS